MGIEVLIRRKTIGKNAADLAPLIVKMRSLAAMQPGYISGETLKCISPADDNEYLVRSSWASVADWNNWFESAQRIEIQEKIDAVTAEKTEYRIYEPLIGGIMQRIG